MIKPLDSRYASLQYVYIGSHAFAMFAHKIFTGTRYLDDPLSNIALLSLYGHAMHVPTLCSIFPDRSMISLYGSTMHKSNWSLIPSPYSYL